MKLLSFIVFFALFYPAPFVFPASKTPLEFHVSEDLMAKSDEFEKLLEHPSLKDLMRDKMIKRPDKCPIENLAVSELYEKLRLVTKAFDSGNCSSGTTGALLKGLSSITEKGALIITLSKNPAASYATLASLSNITDLSQTSAVATTATTETTTETSTSTSSSKTSDYYSTVSSYLVGLSQNDDCVNNLKRKGFLSTLGDIITTMGQASLLVPTGSGFLYSAAGIAVGSTLKILASLFKPPFNWEIPEERAQFEGLICAFFKLRRDIENAHVLGVDKKKTLEEIAAITKQINEINTYKDRLLEEQKSRNQEILSFKENYYNSRQKLETYHLHMAIDTFINKTEEETFKASPNKSQAIKYASDLGRKALLMESFNQLEDFEIMKGLLEPFTSTQIILELHKKKYPDFYIESIEPLLIYLKTNRTILDTELLTPTKDFLALKKTEDSKNNQEIIQLIDDSYLKLLQRVGDTTVYLNTQIQILNNMLKRLQLNTWDAGSSMDFNIVEEYIKIQKSIYEKNGYSYVSYFKETAYDSYKQYKKDYEDLIKKQQVPTFNKDLPWLCRSSKQTVMRWHFANHAVESIWDFLRANEGLFYTNVKRVKLGAQFLPLGRTNQYKLYKDARSSEIAKALYYQEVENENKKREEKEKKQENNDRIALALEKQEEIEKLLHHEAKKHILPQERLRDIKITQLLDKNKLEKKEKELYLKKIDEKRTSQKEKPPLLIYNRNELNSYGLTLKSNLGKLMLQIKYSEAEIKGLTDFRKEYQCTQYE